MSIKDNSVVVLLSLSFSFTAGAIICYKTVIADPKDTKITELKMKLEDRSREITSSIEYRELEKEFIALDVKHQLLIEQLLKLEQKLKLGEDSSNKNEIMKLSLANEQSRLAECLERVESDNKEISLLKENADFSDALKNLKKEQNILQANLQREVSYKSDESQEALRLKKQIEMVQEQIKTFISSSK